MASFERDTAGTPAADVPPIGPTGHPRFDLLRKAVTQRVEVFTSKRRTVKRRATFATIGTAGGSGVTTLALGLRDTFTGFEGALVTGAFVLSALGTLLAVWDGLFKHKELWVQRTVVLNALQRLKLDMDLYAVERTAQQVDEDTVTGFHHQLNAIDHNDMQNWLTIRSDIAAGDPVFPT